MGKVFPAWRQEHGQRGNERYEAGAGSDPTRRCLADRLAPWDLSAGTGWRTATDCQSFPLPSLKKGLSIKGRLLKGWSEPGVRPAHEQHSQ